MSDIAIPINKSHSIHRFHLSLGVGEGGEVCLAMQIGLRSILH